MENGIVIPGFAKQFGLITGMSDRRHGNMSTKKGEWQDEALKNRHDFVAKLGGNPDNLITMAQPHGTEVLLVNTKSQRVQDCDGILAQGPNVWLGVVTADCQPVLLYDEETDIVGTIHVGWRGLTKGIMDNTLEKLRSLANSSLEKVWLFIGPSLCLDHSRFSSPYSELPPEFHRYIADPSREERGYNASPPREEHGQVAGIYDSRDRPARVDLRQITVDSAVAAGVPKSQIEVHPDCTVHLPNRYFSYRASGRTLPGAQIAVIGRR